MTVPRLRATAIPVLLACSVLFLLGLGRWVGGQVAHQADAEMRDNLLRQALEVSYAVNPRLAGKLTFTAGDKGTPAFELLEEQFRNLGASIPCRGIYTMARRDGKIFFGPENYPESDPLASPSGTLYKDPPPETKAIFQTKQPITIGPYKDEYGVFVTALVPILEPATNRMVMVVALDVLAADWDSKVATQRNRVLLISVIACLLLLGTAIAVAWHQRRRNQRDLRLVPWIVVPVAMALLVWTTAFASYQYRNATETERALRNRMLDESRVHWNLLVYGKVQLLQNQMDLVVRELELGRASSLRDPAALGARIEAFQAGLQDDFNIIHLSFVPQGPNLADASRPPALDSSRSYALLAAARTGEDAWGVDRDSNGVLSLRYVRPSGRTGTPDGFWELEMDLKPLAKDLALALGFRVCPIFGLPSQLTDSGSRERVQEGERLYLGVRVDIPDSRGRMAAGFLVQQDVTSIHDRTRGDLIFNIALSFTLMTGVLAMLFVITRRAETRLREAFVEVKNSESHLEELVKNRTSELERALEAANHANQAKTRFLASMSHELRTPLNAILGFAQILSREGGFAASQREKLSVIANAGNHLLAIINDILDLVKIESGKISIEPADFDIGEMIHDLVALLRKQAEAKRLELVVDQSSSFPRFVRSDSAKIRQILSNLVGNAIKFTPAGRVVIKLVVQSLQTESSRMKLHFEIADTGIGIRRDDLERIFEPFVQLEQREGTGLGLAIARQFVRMLGGEVAVQSEVGKGSTFRFTVECDPVERGNAKALAVKHEAIRGIPGAAEKRILLVEDHPDNRLLLHGLLDPFGFQVRDACNGQEGIEAVQGWHPHLVLMDRRMPVLDGLSATRAIRSLDLPVQPVIVAVTAHAFQSERQEMHEAGCDDFLAKPFNETEFFSILALHLHLRLVRDVDVDGGVGEPDVQDLDALANLPESLRRELYEAFRAAHLARIEELLEHVGEQDAGLAKLLADYADNFQYDQVTTALSDLGGGKT